MHRWSSSKKKCGVKNVPVGRIRERAFVASFLHAVDPGGWKIKNVIKRSESGKVAHN